MDLPERGSEVSMGSSFQVANISGIRVYIHWSWIIIFALITYGLGNFFHSSYSWPASTDYIVAALAAVLLFVTVLLHELGHSFTARARGLPVNSITLFFFGGVSNLTQDPQTANTEFLVALAGPLVSLILAGVFYLWYRLVPGWPTEVTAILGYLASINLILALFNLLPAFPLDGGRVFRSIVWMVVKSKRRATHVASNVSQVIAWLFIAAGIAEVFLVKGGLFSGIYLAFMGWFLMNAATATYRQTVVDQVLHGIDVRNVMDAAPPSIGAALPVEELVYQHMLAGNQRAVPVIGPNGQLVGLVTLGDVRHTPRDEWGRATVQQIMTPADRLTTVTPDEGLRDALQALAENSYHQLPVVQNGRLVGMLNRGHVMQYLHMREQLPSGGGGGALPQQRVG